MGVGGWGGRGREQAYSFLFYMHVAVQYQEPFNSAVSMVMYNSAVFMDLYTKGLCPELKMQGLLKPVCVAGWLKE